MAFQTIFTTAGQAAIAAAIASAQPLNITAMAVGDGGGNDVTLDPGQDHLVHELFRAAVNQVYKDPDNAKQFIVEMVIPNTENGFTMREVGVYDSNGVLIAVANTPATYKPTVEDGAFADVVIRLYITVDNASAITVVINPNIAVATRSWVINNITLATLAPGGTTFQVLRKASNQDGDAEWADIDTTNVVVDCIEETQTLAAGQAVVHLTLTTTRGLAVYVNGERLRQDQWTANPVDPTQFTLSAPGNEGDRLICVQNEPAGNAPFPLAQQNNLSDVVDKAVARQNLDVFSRGEMQNLMPAGEIIFYAGAGAPNGFLKANGAAVSRTAYARLFNAIGTIYGAGDGSTTFNLPDMRGLFPRALDDGRGIDIDRGLGTTQQDGLKDHQHEWGGDDHLEFFGYPKSGNPGFGYDATSKFSGDGKRYSTKVHPLYPMINETRPKNISMLACIRY